MYLARRDWAWKFHHRWWNPRLHHLVIEAESADKSGDPQAGKTQDIGRRTPTPSSATGAETDIASRGHGKWVKPAGTAAVAAATAPTVRDGRCTPDRLEAARDHEVRLNPGPGPDSGPGPGHEQVQGRVQFRGGHRLLSGVVCRMAMDLLHFRVDYFCATVVCSSEASHFKGGQATQKQHPHCVFTLPLLSYCMYPPHARAHHSCPTRHTSAEHTGGPQNPCCRSSTGGQP